MAEAAYGGEDAPKPRHHTRLDPTTEAGRAALSKLGVDPADLGGPTDSFHADIWRHDVTGEYVVAYRGTRFTEWDDWKQNYRQGAGFASEDYHKSMLLAEKMDDASGGRVRFTGHSKGGGQAAAAALKTGRPATTYNAAGVHPKTVLAGAEGGAPVTAYHVEGEVLSGLQDHREIVIGGAALGATKLAGPLGGVATLAVLDGDLPRAYGDRRELEAVAPPGPADAAAAAAERGWLSRFVDMVVPDDNPIARHGMDWVTSGLAAKQRALGCPGA